MNYPLEIKEQATNVTYRKIGGDYYEPILCAEGHNVWRFTGKREAEIFNTHINKWEIVQDQCESESPIFMCYICDKKLDVRTFYGFKFRKWEVNN